MSDDVGTLRAASRIHPRSTLRPYMNNEYMRRGGRVTLRIRRCFLSALPSDT